jgi:type VI secretion system secreted protein Hcp
MKLVRVSPSQHRTSRKASLEKKEEDLNMAFNAFINFGDIKGEVTEDKHKDWVAVTKVTFNVSQPASFTRQSAGGGTAEAAEFSALTIEKAIDKATPKLFEAACKGTHLGEVTIEYQRASGDPIVYMQMKLKEVVVSGITHNADPKGDYQFPLEQISLTYGAIEKTYTQQKADGKAGGNVAAKWNVAKGTAA